MGSFTQKKLEKGSFEASTLDDARIDHLPDAHRIRVSDILSSLSSI